MKTIVTLLILVLSTREGLGFTNPAGHVTRAPPRQLFVAPSSEPSVDNTDLEVVVGNEPIRHLSSASLAGFITGVIGFAGQGVASAEDYADLPPPYVPALFSVVLLAGIGVLTSSLGNVMDEGEFRCRISLLSDGNGSFASTPS